MKTHAVAAEFFHADGQIDRQTERQTKLIVGFRNFANAPKISVHSDINFPQSLLVRPPVKGIQDIMTVYHHTKRLTALRG